MLYLGIDQHARQITVSLRDDSGDVLQARQVSRRKANRSAPGVVTARPRLSATTCRRTPLRFAFVVFVGAEPEQHAVSTRGIADWTHRRHLRHRSGLLRRTAQSHAPRSGTPSNSLRFFAEESDDRPKFPRETCTGSQCQRSCASGPRAVNSPRCSFFHWLRNSIGDDMATLKRASKELFCRPGEVAGSH